MSRSTRNTDPFGPPDRDLQPESREAEPGELQSGDAFPRQLGAPVGEPDRIRGLTDPASTGEPSYTLEDLLPPRLCQAEVVSILRPGDLSKGGIGERDGGLASERADRVEGRPLERRARHPAALRPVLVGQLLSVTHETCATR
jgi:hypothetical protein